MFEIVLRAPDSYIDSLYEAVYPQNQVMLGSDMALLEHEVFVTWKDKMLDKFLNYTNLTDFVHDNVENSLTHETIHLLLARDEGFNANYAFDDVDKNYEISGVRG